MDDRGCRKWCVLARKTLQFVALLSFFSFLYSYCSGSSYNLHLSTFIFSLFAHAMDRNYVFLICNLILAFLVKNLSFYSSRGSTNPADSDADADQHSVKQITQMPAILLSQNAATLEYGVTLVAGEEQPECTCQPLHDQHKLQEDDDNEEELKEAEAEAEAEAEQGTSTVEEVSDASVSTEELNQKFEEFIRKMKEEIRIQAQQQPIPHSFS